MQLSGHIRMMNTSLEDGAANYQLPIGEKLIDMNALVGKNIELKYNEAIKCANCGALTKKSWSGGFCFPCTRILAKCDLCIMRPETCHFSQGTCREPHGGLTIAFNQQLFISQTPQNQRLALLTKKGFIAAGLSK